jgi:CheY-like chemotaxis protein
MINKFKAETSGITWPVAEAPSKGISVDLTPNSPSEVSNDPLRVLIVDDNHDGADLLAALLKREGHSVQTAYCGLDALHIAAEFVPHFVLLDIGLPDIDGYEVARRLCAKKGDQSVVLVAVTGWGQAQDKLLAQSAGFDYHLVKPVNFKNLMDLLYSACKGLPSITAVGHQ